MATLLVVDDEMGIRELLSEILDDEGHEVLLAENAAAARVLFGTRAFDLVLLDIWMPDTDGMSLLREWTSAAPLPCPVIMMSGHASIDTAVEAQALGATGFLEKPITTHKLLSAVHKALHRSAAHTQLDAHSLSATVPATALLDARALPQDEFNSLASSLQPNTGGPDGADNTVFGLANHTAPARSNAPTLSSDPSLTIWQEAMSQVNLNVDLREFREHAERVYFTHLIEREQWAMTRVADQAGLERTHLYRKLKQLGIEITRRGRI